MLIVYRLSASLHKTGRRKKLAKTTHYLSYSAFWTHGCVPLTAAHRVSDVIYHVALWTWQTRIQRNLRHCRRYSAFTMQSPLRVKTGRWSVNGALANRFLFAPFVINGNRHRFIICNWSCSSQPRLARRKQRSSRRKQRSSSVTCDRRMWAVTNLFVAIWWNAIRIVPSNSQYLH